METTDHGNQFYEENGDERNGQRSSSRPRFVRTDSDHRSFSKVDRPQYGHRDDNRGYRERGTGYGSERRSWNQDRDNGYNSNERRSSYGSRDKDYGERRSSYGNRGGYGSGNGERRNSYGNNYGDRYGNYNNGERRSNYGYRGEQGGSYEQGERRPYGDRPNNNGGYRKPAYNAAQSRQKPRGTQAPFPKKKTIEYRDVINDPNEPIRLNKYLANAGVCSRREADDFIQAGVVKVNGETITELGTKVRRGDVVMFHDQSVGIERKIYIVLNKPKNCVTTVDDPQERKTVMDYIKGACTERVYPVGRLDRNTTGVLLLTNDGELATKLTHPKFKKKKIYHVFLDRKLEQADYDKLINGVELEPGDVVCADEASYVNDKPDEIGVEIHSGRNRIVRRMFDALGYKVLKLDRVQFAGLTKKKLRRGDWRFLTEQEVNMLRMGSYE